MEWDKGYKASYYISIVDRATMRDVDRVEIESGSIKRTLSDLRESADISLKKTVFNQEQLIRVWLDARQDSSLSHTPLFTGIAICPKNKFTGRLLSNNLECYSVLKYAEDVLLPLGWYAPVEANGAALARNLLSIIGVPIEVADNSPILKQSIVAEQNENHLSMADKILDAMNWALQINGMGSLYLGPIDHEEKAKFDANEFDIIENEIEIEYDWYSAPNVLRCTLDDSYSEARDDDPNSPLSTMSRGREVWLAETDVQLNTGETLAEYTQRRLKELQRAATTVNYNRRFFPGVNPGNVVRIGYPAQGVNGLYLVTNQTLNLGYNCRTSEEVYKL